MLSGSIPFALMRAWPLPDAYAVERMRRDRQDQVPGGAAAIDIFPIGTGTLRGTVVTIVRTSTKRTGHFAKARSTDSSENQSKGYSESHVSEGEAENNCGRDADHNSEACAKCRT